MSNTFTYEVDDDGSIRDIDRDTVLKLLNASLTRKLSQCIYPGPATIASSDSIDEDRWDRWDPVVVAADGTKFEISSTCLDTDPCQHYVCINGEEQQATWWMTKIIAWCDKNKCPYPEHVQEEVDALKARKS